MPDPTKLSNEELAKWHDEQAVEAESDDCPVAASMHDETSRRLRALSPRPIEEAPRDGQSVYGLVACWYHQDCGDWLTDEESTAVSPAHFIDLSALEVPAQEKGREDG